MGVSPMATFLRVEGPIPAIRGRYVSYVCASRSIGSSPDLERQRLAASRVVSNGKSRIVAEFVEWLPCEDREFAELHFAIRKCKEVNAALLIASIRRFERNIKFLDVLQDSRVRFLAADRHCSNHLTVHHMIIAEEYRRKGIGDRVRKSLAESKKRGINLGGARGNIHDLRKGPSVSVEARRRKAQATAALAVKHIQRLIAEERMSLRRLAAELNELGISAPKGGQWSAAQVRAALIRCGVYNIHAAGSCDPAKSQGCRST